MQAVSPAKWTHRGTRGLVMALLGASIALSLALVAGLALDPWFLPNTLTRNGGGNDMSWLLDLVLAVTGVWVWVEVLSARVSARDGWCWTSRARRSLKSTAADAGTVSEPSRRNLSRIVALTDGLACGHLTARQHGVVREIQLAAQAALTSLNDAADLASDVRAADYVRDQLVFDLRVCLDDALTLVQQRSASKGQHLALALDLPPRLPVYGDAARIRRLVTGMAEQGLRHALSQPAQVAVVATPRASDTVRLFVDVVCDGDLRAESRSALHPALATAAGGVWAARKVSGGWRCSFEIDLPRAPALSDLSLPMPTDLRGRRALLIEPLLPAESWVRRNLQSLGLDTESAANTEEALAYLVAGHESGQPIEVVVVSGFDSRVALAVPGAAGHESLGTETKFILLDDTGARGDAARASQAGYACYLTRPLTSRLFASAVVRCLARPADPMPLVTRHALSANVPRIVMVDGSLITQEVARNGLSTHGYRVEFAANGSEALAAVTRATPDLVMIDMHVSCVDGTGLAKLIRHLADTIPYTPLVAMSVGATDAMREQVIRAGATDVVIRPGNVEEIVAFVERFLRVPALAAMSEPDIDTALVPLFVSESDIRLQALREALTDNDSGRVAREAHTLKGTSLLFGGTALSEVARRIEAAAGAGTLELARALVPALERHYAALRARLTTAGLEFKRGDDVAR